MFRYSAIAGLSWFWTVLLFGSQANVARGQSEGPSQVIAINVALDPDEIMVERAKAVNTRLRSVFRKGYALDESHHPHITCLQCFVKVADLVKLYAALDKVMGSEKPSALKLKATRYYYLPSKDMGLAGIVIEPTEGIARFQKMIVDTVIPYTVESGDKTAFFTTKDEPDLEPSLFDYVKNFVAKSSGKQYNPHVTTGLAKRDYLDALVNEKFEAFTFSPTGVSVYQLGNYGTARKQLKSWKK